MRATRRVTWLAAALAPLVSCTALASDLATRHPGRGIQVAQLDGGPYGGPGGPYDGGPGGPGYGPGGPDGPAYGSPGYGGPGGYGGPTGYGPPEGPAYGGGRSRSGGPTQTVTYHGFRIAFRGPADEQQLAAVEHQIDMVDNAGLSSADMRLFRSKTIEVSSDARSESKRGRGIVLGDNLQRGQTRPILLHEYMHVLHRSTFPGGFNNKTIEHFYEEALANNLYESGSYMMRDRREFFAVTASCFLYGSVERPPYTREAIAQAQPDYYAYLVRLFGRGQPGLAPTARHSRRLAG